MKAIEGRTENREEWLCTCAEAAALIKKAPKGSRFLIHIRIDTPIIDEEEKFFRSGASAFTTVSRKEAIRIVTGSITSTLEGRGARLPIRSYSFTSHPNTKIYWIG